MKKIINHIKENWIKYGFETFVITVGILGAFALNNWNEGRKNLIKEKSAISDIHQEFLKNQLQLEYIKSEHESRLLHIRKLLDLFPIEKNNVNLDSVRHYMRRSSGDWTFEPLQGRIKWLVNSNNFDLIKNTELKDALLLWEPVYEDYHEDEMDAKAFNHDYLFPYYRKHFSADLDLNDKRINLDILESLEYEQMMFWHYIRLAAIVENDTNELQRLESLIKKIITLTDNQ